MYYPILKKGNNEIAALSHIDSKYKNEIIPIIEAPQSLDTSDWEKLHTLGAYLKRKVPNLQLSFQFSTLFNGIAKSSAEAWTDTKGNNIITYLYNNISNEYPNFIPCFNFDDDDWIVNSIDNNSKKILIRFEMHKFNSGLDNVIFTSIIDKFSKKFPNSKLGIIIDCYNKNIDISRINNAINIIESTQDDAEIIFSETNCPEDVSVVNHSSFGIAAQRNEFKKYEILKQNHPKLSFSDYAVRLKPDLSDKDKSGMNMNTTYLKIIYTTENNYYVAKSGQIGKQETDPTHKTISYACNLITQSNEYYGENFSWGDKQIKECSIGKLKINSHQKPIAIGISHHLAVVLSQL